MPNLDGLSNLTNVSGELVITYNDGLTTIDGLTNLQDVSGSLSVTFNDILSQCCALSSLLKAGNDNVYVIWNDIGWNSNEEILMTDCGICIQVFSSPTCIGTSNGELNIFVDGYDTIPFNYLWEEVSGLGISGSVVNQEDIFSINNLPSGTYNVSVTQPNGEQAFVNDVVLGPITGVAFDVTNIVAINSVNGLAVGSISLEFIGGVSPYSFQWAGQSTGNISGVTDLNYTIENLEAGDYTIQITDDDGAATQVEITLLDDSLPEADCVHPLDVIILNLVSTAINGDEYAKSKVYFEEFVKTLPIGSGPLILK